MCRLEFQRWLFLHCWTHHFILFLKRIVSNSLMKLLLKKKDGILSSEKDDASTAHW